MPTGAELVRRYDELKGERGTWESQWQEVADEMLGRRDITTQESPGRKRMARIYDTTSLLSADLLAGGLHSFLTNSATKWFALKTEDDRLMEIEEVARWMEFAGNRLLSAFNRPEAGFDPHMHEVYFDIVSFGTSNLFEEDERGQDGVSRGPLFIARPLSEMYIAENDAGRVDSVFRRYTLTARQTVQHFGSRAPSLAKKKVSSGKVDEKIELLHAIMPREDPVPGRLLAIQMPFASFHVDIKTKAIIRESGFRTFPSMHPRWSRDAGEIYGRGPGIIALADARMMNEMWKTTLTGAQKAINPPLLVDDDAVIGQLRTAPNAVITRRSTALRTDSVRPLETGADPRLGLDLIENKAKNIRSAFKAEMMPLFQNPLQTATQVIEIANQAQRFLSPVMGRLKSELLEPMLERAFDIELNRGALGRPPDVLFGQNIRVEYVSPIQRAQRASEAQAIMETWTLAAQIAETTGDPLVTQVLNSEESIRLIAEANGVPVSAINDRETFAAIRKAAQQRAAADEQREQGLEDLQVAGDVAPKLQALAGGQAA